MVKEKIPVGAKYYGKRGFTRQVQVYLTDSEHEKLHRLAKEKNRSAVSLGREWIVKRLKTS